MKRVQSPEKAINCPSFSLQTWERLLKFWFFDRCRNGNRCDLYGLTPIWHRIGGGTISGSLQIASLQFRVPMKFRRTGQQSGFIKSMAVIRNGLSYHTLCHAKATEQQT